MISQKKYIEGLNTLRFFAAFLVIIGHCRSNLISYDIHWMSQSPILYKGEMAVEFFFVLSGFLLTYLAIMEYNKDQAINIKHFFIRRSLRIFPLYYLAVMLSFILLGYLFPIYKGAAYYLFQLKRDSFTICYFYPILY